jgi:collagenase-like PrtC family protease
MAKARFHLPGLRFNYPLNMFWVSMQKAHPEYFREVEIASFFGEFPMSLWTGGRFVGGDQCDAGYIKNVIKSVNDLGIPIRYTYTNPEITEADLDDPYCNFCMKCADNGMNEVMIFSPVLEKYLREKYPNFKYNSSTCKEIKDLDTLNAEIAKDYQYVVLDYNLNYRWDILEKVEHPEKLELLVNTLCIPDCPRRGDHYKNQAQNERIVIRNRELPPEKRIPVIPWHCEYGDKNNIHTIQNYKTFIKPDDIWEKYIPMGITNFKIEGRTANLFSLIDTYCFFMLKPEYAGEARLLLINNLMHAGVVTVNKPRPSRWP